MSIGHTKHCIGCGNEISEFTDISGFMRCPDAHHARDVIMDLMPRYASEKNCRIAMHILASGGYDMSSWDKRADVYTPHISIIAELANKLMRHEKLNGARFHDDDILCKNCVKKQSVCTACGNQHKPICPICDAELVPLL